MSPVWTQVVEAFRFDLLGYLLLAVLYGGAIGLERELKRKPAGLRTNILICVGSALFTQLSIAVAGAAGDPARIAAQIVTGVGFIGAGTILHTRGQVSGLTSAATIWLVAAIGVAIGAGAVLEATGATLLVVLVLVFLGWLEQFLRRVGGMSRVVIEVERDPERVARIEELVRQAGLEIVELRTQDRDQRLVIEVLLRGPQRAHDEARLQLLRTSGTYSVAVEE